MLHRGHGRLVLQRHQEGHADLRQHAAGACEGEVLAEARGWRIIVDACLVKHGESDGQNANYGARLTEWQADVDLDVKAITGQAADVHFLLHMPSSAWSGTDGIRGMVAAQSDVIHLAGPDYPSRTPTPRTSATCLGRATS